MIIKTFNISVLTESDNVSFVVGQHLCPTGVELVRLLIANTVKPDATGTDTPAPPFPRATQVEIATFLSNGGQIKRFRPVKAKAKVQTVEELLTLLGIN